MKLRIERPDWKLCINNSCDKPSCNAAPLALDRWFDKHVKPINKALEAGVEVYGNDEHIWWHEGAPGNSAESKALLINIEPIRKESAEDVLRDMVKNFHPDLYETDTEAFKLFDRAKKVLGEQDE